MAGTSIRLLGIEQGNGTALSQSYNISSFADDLVGQLANGFQANKLIFTFDALIL